MRAESGVGQPAVGSFFARCHTVDTICTLFLTSALDDAALPLFSLMCGCVSGGSRLAKRGETVRRRGQSRCSRTEPNGRSDERHLWHAHHSAQHSHTSSDQPRTIVHTLEQTANSHRRVQHHCDPAQLPAARFPSPVPAPVSPLNPLHAMGACTSTIAMQGQTGRRQLCGQHAACSCSDPFTMQPRSWSGSAAS